MTRFLALILALILTATAAEAGPVAAVISALAGGSVALAIGKIVLSLVIAAYQQRRMKKKLAASQQGIKTQYTGVGGTTPLTVIVGRYATAGQLEAPQNAQPRNSSPPQKWLTYVIGLGDVPGMRLTGRVVINDDWHVFKTPPNGVSNDYGATVEGDLEDYCWFRFHDGTQTEADAMLRLKFGEDSDRPWEADMIGRGIPYVVATFKRNQKRFPGEPRLRFEVEGIPLYDPRQDSSVGGSGAQRWDSPATWTFTENPKVIEYNILRGIRIEGFGIWGGDAKASELPLDNWFAAMNACDVEVDDGDGGTEPAYRFGFEFGLDQTPAEIIDEINRSCAGETVEIAGSYKTRVGTVNLPVYFFTDGDVIVTRAQQLDPFPSIDQTFNALTCSYPDPEILWEAREAPPLTNDLWEMEDGLIVWDGTAFATQPRRLLRQVSLPGVPFPLQVQRVLAAEAAKGRRRRSHGLTLPPSALVLEPLDAVSWTSDRNGYAAKVFEVVTVADPVDELRPQIGLVEADPDDDTPPDYVPLTTPTISNPPTASVSVVGFDAEAWAVTDAAGAPRRAGLRMLWDADENADLRGLGWQVRLVVTGATVASGTVSDLTGGRHEVELLPGLTYEVRMWPLTDRPFVATGWVVVTTDDLRLGPGDFTDEVQAAIAEALVVRDAANARADEVLAEAEQAVADLRTAAEAAIGEVLEGVATPLLDRVAGLDASMVQRIDDIARIDRDLELSQPRQIDTASAVDTLAERLAWLSLSLSRFQSDMADAGLYIDPASGRATLEAVARIDNAFSEVGIAVDALRSEVSLKASYAEVLDVVTSIQLDPAQLPILSAITGRISAAEVAVSGLLGAITAKADTVVLDEVSARVTTAEASIDSLEAEIVLRVPTVTFDLLETRVSNAEITLGSLDVPSLTLAVSDARAAREAVDDLSLAQLQALLQGREDREAAQADIAYARQDMRALVDEDRQAMAEIRQEIGVAVADATALVVSEQTARATETSALSQRADDLAAAVDGQAASISEINRVEADSASASARALRQVQLDLGVVSGDVAAQVAAISALTGRVEVTEDGLEAEARDTQILQVRVGEAGEAGALANLRAILADQTARELVRAGVADVRTDTWAQVAEDREAIAGLRQELTTAIQSATVRIDAERSARVTATEAVASDILDLRADLGDTAAGLSEEALARASADGALSSRATALEATVNNGTTGVSATATAVSDLTARVTTAEGDITTQASQIGSLQSALPGKADASALTALTTRVTTAEGNITTQSGQITSLNAALPGKADASAVTALTARVSETEDGIETLSAAQTTLSGQVNNPTTGLAATRAEIDDLDALITTPTTGIATRLSATEAAVFNPTTGLPATRAEVIVQQAAIAEIEGRASASYVLRVKAGGASAGLEVVAADDPVSGAGSVIRLAGDQIIVNGTTFLDNAFIEALIARQATIDSLRVSTVMLKGQAVTIPVYLAWPGVVRPAASPGTTVAAGAIRREGLATVIGFGCQFSGAAYSEAVFQLRRNGTVINSFASATGQRGAAQSVFSQFVDQDTGTGVTNYRVDCIWSGGGQPLITQRALNMVQTKR